MELMKRGKLLLVVMIATFLTFSFLTFALTASAYYVSGDTTKAIYELLQGFIRFALECLLFIVLFRGYPWAKIVTMVLMAFGDLASLVAISFFPIMSLYVVVYTAFIITLLLKPVNEFLKSQREKRVQQSIKSPTI